MSVSCGRFTGEGTPSNQRTGRRHTKRSNSWRNATLRERIPPPIGVVKGPLIAIKYSLINSKVSLGSHSPVWLNAFSPAKTSFQTILRSPLYAFSTAASRTRTEAAQMSGPVPSPSIKGTIGLFGTFNTPSLTVIFSPCMLFSPSKILIH